MTFVDGWFPSIRPDGVIASGSSGIWTYPLVGNPVQISPLGTSPLWVGRTLVYNHNDGTTIVGSTILNKAFTEYASNGQNLFAGFTSGNPGEIRQYQIVFANNPGPAMTVHEVEFPIVGGCKPRYYGQALGYLTPYITDVSLMRSLIIDGVIEASGIIIDWIPDKDGTFYTYTVFVGKSSSGQDLKEIHDSLGNNVTIRPQKDEVPKVCFIGPDNLPYMVSQINSGTIVRMQYSSQGYFHPAIFDDPDAAMIGDQLHVVGSNRGNPVSYLIDFNAPKVDLTLL